MPQNKIASNLRQILSTCMEEKNFTNIYEIYFYANFYRHIHIYSSEEYW